MDRLRTGRRPDVWHSVYGLKQSRRVGTGSWRRGEKKRKTRLDITRRERQRNRENCYRTLKRLTPIGLDEPKESCTGMTEACTSRDALLAICSSCFLHCAFLVFYFVLFYFPPYQQHWGGGRRCQTSSFCSLFPAQQITSGTGQRVQYFFGVGNQYAECEKQHNNNHATIS